MIVTLHVCPFLYALYELENYIIKKATSTLLSVINVYVCVCMRKASCKRKESSYYERYKTEILIVSLLHILGYLVHFYFTDVQPIYRIM